MNNENKTAGRPELAKEEARTKVLAFKVNQAEIDELEKAFGKKFLASTMRDVMLQYARLVNKNK